MAHTTARVDGSMLVIGVNDTNPITVGSDAWFAWLETATAFVFTSPAGRFTARKERRDRGTWYWKAYRTDQGVLRRAYLGKSPDLTLDQLTRAAATLTQVATPVAPKPAPAVALPPDQPTATVRPADFLLANLLATKLFVPPARANLVARPRLFERVQAGLRDKLTLIAAPAGFGKTTLLSAWRATVAGGAWPFAWVALDSADNDPLRFWSYVIAALDTLAPGVGAPALTLLQSPQPPPIERILTSVLNAFSASAAGAPVRDVGLALDDYHVITAPAIHETLAWLLDYLPPNLHLIILTRADPALPLARLRARGAMTELHANDLRFTPDEAATFLNQVMGLSLTPADVTALEARTEGWIAGLQLAALSLRGREDIPGFIQAFTGDNRYIGDYLVEEVLQRQPPPVRAFLLQTAILDRLCGPLCDAVTQQTDGSGLLALLERANLFVMPLDDKREWFRYHHLFADVLRTYLQKELPDQVATLQQRASAWYAEQGQQSEAIRYALAAHDFRRAARLIEREWRVYHRSQFRSAAVLGWMKALPDEMVRASPSLSIGYAWELLNIGENEAAASHLHDAELALDSAANNVPLRTLQMDIANARAYLALARDDLPGTIAYAQRAIDLCPADDHLARALLESLFGLAKMATGDLEEARHSLSAAQRGVEQAGNILFAIGMTYVIADVQVAQGRLRGAIRTYEEALQLAGIHPAAPQPNPILQGTAELYLGLGDLQHELGNVAAAYDNLQKSESLGEAMALPNWSYRLRLVQARIKQSEGDLDRALSLLEAAEHLYYRSPVPEVYPLAAMRARVWIAQGRLDEAMRWAEARGLSVNDDLSFVREFEHITLARLLIARYRQDHDGRAIGEALALLARLLTAAEAGERMGSVIEILLLQALAYQAAGEIVQARPALERALLLAEPEGYVRVFVDEGAPMRQLLSAASARGTLPDYTSKLLAAFADEAELRTPHSALVDPLSQRELEVLHLIAQGFSNQEIGARLFLAVDTVKGHNRRIFDKLQVQRRTEAVAKARSLNLLSSH